MIKRILCAILVITAFLSLVSCGRRYPDYLTSEYVQEHYELIDMNLVYLRTNKKQLVSTVESGQSCKFVKIKDVPVEQFIGIASSQILFSSLWGPRPRYILFNAENSVDPIKNFEIEDVEIYARDDSKRKSPEYEYYGEFIYAEHIYDISDLIVLQEMLESIWYADRENIDAHILEDKDKTVTVRIHFKEYENIVWDAVVAVEKEKYYLQILLVNEEEGIFFRGGCYAYIYVGPHFDALMESLFAADL